jgi:hypothetical protein
MFMQFPEVSIFIDISAVRLLFSYSSFLIFFFLCLRSKMSKKGLSNRETALFDFLHLKNLEKNRGAKVQNKICA